MNHHDRYHLQSQPHDNGDTDLLSEDAQEGRSRGRRRHDHAAQILHDDAVPDNNNSGGAAATAKETPPGTTAATETIASTTTHNIRTQQQLPQSIEEFASNNNSNNNNDNHKNNLGNLMPPTSINVPQTAVASDNQSTASSITLAGAFQNADLYVSSLYPSTRVIESAAVPTITTHTECTKAVTSDTNVLGIHPSTSSSSTVPSAAATTKAGAAREAPATARTKYNKRKDPNDIPEHAAQFALGLEELGQIELSVLKSGQQPNPDPQAGEDAIMPLPASQWEDVISPQPGEDIISGIMPLPTRQQQQPMGPGAHAISSPGGWNPFGDQSSGTEDTKEDSKEESKRDTNFYSNATLGLALAQPADALPIAEVDEEMGEQQQKQKQPISFLGFLAGIPRPWRHLLMVASAVIMVKWSTYIIRSIIVGARDPATLRIRQSIEESFGEDYFDSELKEKALHWIIHEDPLQDLEVKQGLQQGSETSSLIQRFSLVAFYFQTSATQPWSYCNPPQGKQSDVCFYRDRISMGQSEATRWLSAAHECHWMGVHCEAGSKIVSTMRLPNMNMTGNIPSELAKLSNLESLDLSRNRFTGSLPLWINQLSSIETLYLKSNFLSGRVLPSLFLISSLSYLSLNSNLLGGPIPSQIGLFSGLSLGLSKNDFSGPIPTETYQLSNLQDLVMCHNRLTGTISTLIGQLTNLEGLYLYNNELGYTIPTEVGLLGRLITLNLKRTNLDGTIPEELFNLKSLMQLYISDTKIGGPISTRFGQLGELQECHLANTRISGTIPEQLSLLSKLRIFHANGNPSLSGSMPVKFCANRLQHNDIVVDCSPAASTGVPAVVCPKGCCSACCDVETKICMEQ